MNLTRKNLKLTKKTLFLYKKQIVKLSHYSTTDPTGVFAGTTATMPSRV